MASSLSLAGCITFGLFSLPQSASGQSPDPRQTMPHDCMPMMGNCGREWMGRGSMMGGASMIRHRYFMQNGLPKLYSGKANPLGPSPKTVTEGAVLYANNCASCHGAHGFGDGEAGRDLNPPPANIAHIIQMPMFNDAYLYWTIADGGKPIGSAMPEFKEVLAEQEIWKIIIAMRAGLPAPPRSRQSN